MEPNWTTARDLFERDLQVYETPSGESLPVSLEEQSSGSMEEDQAEGDLPGDLPSTLEFSDAEGRSQDSWQREGRPKLTRQTATVGTANLSGEGTYFCELL